MKTEHELLHEICNKIEYKYNKYGFTFSRRRGNHGYFVYSGRVTMINLIEMIFTPEFMDKLKIEIYQIYKTQFQVNLKLEKLLNHLDNPVEYLANILNINKE